MLGSLDDDDGSNDMFWQAISKIVFLFIFLLSSFFFLFLVQWTSSSFDIFYFMEIYLMVYALLAGS
jgi:hypothetical protein